MSITNDNGQDLNQYYEKEPDWFDECGNDSKVHLINASPYDVHETLYYIFKHLA